MIGILDYRICNVGSVKRMFERVGAAAEIFRDSHEIEMARGLILPGVGHFDHGMAGLARYFDLELIRECVVERGVPILGICLGMQLLCNSSEEGTTPGLGLVDASVRRFVASDTRLKLPHMGWNSVTTARPNHLLPPIDKAQRFYFVHSYYVQPHREDIVTGTTDYGSRFCSSFEQGTIFGVQFHPEKSHRFGLDLFARFAQVVA